MILRATWKVQVKINKQNWQVFRVSHMILKAVNLHFLKDIRNFKSYLCRLKFKINLILLKVNNRRALIVHFY